VRVEIVQVDERDSHWEDSSTRYRVYFFGDSSRAFARPAGYGVDTYDVTDADVLEVIAWAQEHAGDRDLFSVALVGEDDRLGRGLTWLVGGDLNDNDVFRKHRDAMVRRRDQPVVNMP
jgi:hypothetical protein